MIATKQFDQIELLLGECSEAGWDGYDAVPLTWEAAYRTVVLLFMLPDGLPEPHLTPESDGGIALDWSSTNKDVVSISWDGKFIWACNIQSDWSARKVPSCGSFHQVPPPILVEILRRFV